MISMLGSGKLSLGKALLRSLKLVQQQMPPFSLEIGTRFETHSG